MSCFKPLYTSVEDMANLRLVMVVICILAQGGEKKQGESFDKLYTTNVNEKINLCITNKNKNHNMCKFYKM